MENSLTQPINNIVPLRNSSKCISRAHTTPALSSLADDFLMTVCNQMLVSREVREVVFTHQLLEYPFLPFFHQHLLLFFTQVKTKTKTKKPYILNNGSMLLPSHQ